jgi:hypothetical protein
MQKVNADRAVFEHQKALTALEDLNAEEAHQQEMREIEDNERTLREEMLAEFAARKKKRCQDLIDSTAKESLKAISERREQLEEYVRNNKILRENEKLLEKEKFWMNPGWFKPYSDGTWNGE